MTKIFAHRGSSGTHPENTMEAFREAVRIGADAIELDVHYTKDDELAVIHDDTVNRTTDGKGYVREFTLKELQQLDAGTWFHKKYKGERIPSLKEVAYWLQNHPHLLLNIELKYGLGSGDYSQYEEKAIQEIENHRLTNRVIISSFNHDALKRIKALKPHIECAILYMKRLYDPWDYVEKIGADALHPKAKAANKALLIHAKARDIPVRVFTVNKKRLLKKFLSVRCPAIITDYPEKALQLRKEIQGR